MRLKMSCRSRRSRAPLSLLVLPMLLASGAAAAQDEVYVPIETREVRGYLMVQGVNSRTGNFAVTYPAFDRHGVPYRRTYNSNADNRGTFGLGWGSSFDTRAVGLPDGRVAVLENGNGAITVYGPGPADETREQMERAVAKALVHPSGAARRYINNQLAIESKYAMAEATNCGAAVLGTSLTGYIRMTCPGRVEYFDEDGRLVKYTDSSAGDDRTVMIERSETGDIASIHDDAGHSLRFSRTGATLKVTDETNAWLSYDFDAHGRNTRITGSDAPAYTFEYGPNGRMGAIRYIDGTSQRIAYDQAGRTSRLTLRNDDIYEFRHDPASSQTLVIQRPHDGAPTGLLVKFTDP
ncbi:DUF6531 domain-containing protein [Sphingopyxis sp.]|uniref:DUF6531 domain-containing protein n=1 Tax=Sphingopyxis sp. TaxID=1908224 RepID=UPI0035B452EA